MPENIFLNLKTLVVSTASKADDERKPVWCPRTLSASFVNNSSEYL